MGNTYTKEEIPESTEEWKQFWADIAIQYGDDAEVDEDNIDSFDGSYSPRPRFGISSNKFLENSKMEDVSI